MGTFATALVFTACNKDDDDNMNDVNAQDETFIVKASQSNRSEIQTSQLAVTKGTDSMVKVYANMMITDHTTAQQELEDVVDDVNTDANLNEPLDAEQTAMLAMLQALSGTAFDSAYLDGQVKGHTKTLVNFDAEISGGQNAQVKGYATAKRPAIQMHLTMADSLFKADFQ
jgi:putative membrane protein